jgi:hypothetical protein
VAEPSVFDDVAAILPSLVPEELGEVRLMPRRWGIKVWFGPVKPTREHYEAQVLGKDADPAAKVLCIEVGFHAEGSKEDDNDRAIAALVAARKAWKAVIGDEAVAGDFLGGGTRWRRISETWPDPDLGDSDLAFEIAARLCDYISAFEPIRRAVTVTS